MHFGQLNMMGGRMMLLLVGLIVMPGFSGCRSGKKEPAREVLSVSIEPVQYFVDRLTGGALEVNVMVPAGASHGTYSPTPQQFQRLSDSGLYLRIGYLGYEQAWIGRLKELNPAMEVVNLSDHVRLIRGQEVVHGDHVHEGGIDPHIWMSPAVMIELLPVIKNAINTHYPGYREVVEANHALLESEIQEVHRIFVELSGTLSNHSFMIFHPALTYLARDYGFEQISIEHDGKEPSPAMLGRMIREARDHQISVVFIQEEYDMRSAALVGEETGAALIRINPMDYDWMAAMYALAETFKEHLQ
ncbi:MAG: zinc ABC transporter substrate-binding protein [Bacteroidales bacterium]